MNFMRIQKPYEQLQESVLTINQHQNEGKEISIQVNLVKVIKDIVSELHYKSNVASSLVQNGIVC